MKNLIGTPTKNQTILTCAVTAFLFLRILVTSDFFTSDTYSNRQYLIFGIIILCCTAISAVSVVLYRAGRTQR